MHDLIDIGANLTHDSFDADREAVLARAAAAGVARIIVTGTSVTSSVQAGALCETRPQTLFATAGVHPHHAADFDAHTAAALRSLLAARAFVAVGECGLDFFRDYSPRLAQRQAFEAQLELAATVRKPVFLHQRDAHDEFVALLKPVRGRLVGGVAHCFTDGPRELEDYLDLDLYVGVTGWVCDERRGAQLRAAVPLIPLDRLLIETDAPYLLPRDLAPKPQSRRNEPHFLVHVLERIAALRNQSAEALAAATTANAERLFGIARDG
ncbi:MAG TPA: TatD family hydrolase [Gammaproteobacteria bacterium]|nr:TatD family hydrolase [Gammaproteobacteria bacterium]